MIKKLHINNYALFKNVEIDFTDGFTVISGDTGAGKSIMLDALSLVLGKRVDRFAESSATQKSIIEAEFLLNDSPIFRVDEYRLFIPHQCSFPIPTEIG